MCARRRSSAVLPVCVARSKDAADIFWLCVAGLASAFWTAALHLFIRDRRSAPNVGREFGRLARACRRRAPAFNGVFPRAGIPAGAVALLATKNRDEPAVSRQPADKFCLFTRMKTR